MIQTTFHIAFTVKVFHSYFEDQICNCIQFNATPTTAELLRRYHFRLRKTSNGFELQTNSTPIAPLLTYITNATGISSFDFEMSSQDENFNIFTDLPINWVGQLHYDSKSTINTEELGVTILGTTLVDAKVAPILGTLTIHFDDLIKQGSQNESQYFKINYKSRSTQWQYYIINRSLVPLNNPIIVGKSGIKFEGPHHTVIDTGEQALLFSSNDNLIPLSRFPIYKFDLVDAPIESGLEKYVGLKTIVKGLPNPKTAQFGSVKSDIKLVSSPMYVYV